MSDCAPPLPDVHQATLDDETLGRLFRDLAVCAEVREVRIRPAGETTGVPPGIASLDDARRGLADGSAGAVRIRYLHEGTPWLDTLRPVDGGVLIVRITDPLEGPTP